MVSLLTVLKGLPLTYNRDLQEDKEGFFDTLDTLLDTLRVMTGMYESLTLDEARLRRAAEASHVLATDVADYLVARGMPFREAHGVSARLSIHASDTDRTLSDLTMDDYRQFSVLFGEDVLEITVDSSIEARDVPGGAASAQVAAAIEAAERALEAEAGG